MFYLDFAAVEIVVSLIIRRKRDLFLCRTVVGNRPEELGK